MEKETKIKLAKLGLRITADVTARVVYSKVFSRYERPDYDITPGLVKYRDYVSILPREEMTFKSNNATLRAYFYERKDSNNLILLAHGFHAGADDLLPVAFYFYSKGYSVFTYDSTGTFDSGGKGTIGFCQWLVDVDHAITFIQKNKRFKKMNLYLVGHSCGGYAVSAVLSLKKKIKACAAIAAPNSGFTLLLEKGNQYAGEIASEGMPKEFLDSHQKHLFGKYTNYTSFDGVNNSKVPTFIAHGLEDEVINFDEQSLISYRDKIKNPDVEYYFGTGTQVGHVSILFSDSANFLQKEVEVKFKEIDKKYKKDQAKKREEKALICNELNHYNYSELNPVLFEKIIEFFARYK